MSTPRTPRDAERDRLPKIGEGTDDSAESEVGHEALHGADGEWEDLELNSSVLDDTPTKSERGSEEAETSDDKSLTDAPAAGAISSTTDDADSGEAAAPTGSVHSNGDAGQKADSRALQGDDVDVACQGADTRDSQDEAASKGGLSETSPEDAAAEEGTADSGPANAADGEETCKRVKTLKDYIEGRASRSPRGVDLEQIKVPIWCYHHKCRMQRANRTLTHFPSSDLRRHPPGART